MGRPRVDDLVLLRMYMARVCFGLSDRECEDQVWDSATMRSFVGVAPFEVPDATTLCKFRHLLERCGVGKAMVSSAFGSAADGGLAVSRGTIVDATLYRLGTQNTMLYHSFQTRTYQQSFLDNHFLLYCRFAPYQQHF